MNIAQYRADTPDHGGNDATYLLAIVVVTSVEIQRYLLSILVLLVEQMDTYLGSVHKCSHYQITVPITIYYIHMVHNSW